MPHSRLEKSSWLFSVITVAVAGAGRRFLAQITRHQNEAKFFGASLQYSNYAGQVDEGIMKEYERKMNCLSKCDGKYEFRNEEN